MCRSMAHSAHYYEDLSDAEMAAADKAATPEERIAHLESAFRFAQAACLQRKKEGNVVDLSSGTRERD